MTDQPPYQPFLPPPGSGPQPPRHVFPPGMLAATESGPIWISRLTARQRTGLLLMGGALTLVLLCCGGLTVVGSTVEPAPPARPTPVADAGELPAHSEPAGSPPATPSAPPPSSAPSGTPSHSPSPTASPSPVVEVRTVSETERVRHGTRTVKDPSLAKGKRVVGTRGVDGVRTLTYRVTVTDGKQTGRKLVRSVVTRKPVTEVVRVGTKSASRCDPNYSGCVPIASDVDCGGGSGNGPAYLYGVVEVIGVDIYDLDRDNDGLACERD